MWGDIMKVISKKIDMIAYFKNNGEINPIKFKLDNENEVKIIKIDKIIDIKKEKLCGNKMMVFTCSSIIDGIENIYEIKYDIERYTWILFKI